MTDSAGVGFDRTAFTVDWDGQQVTCPQHQTSTSWSPAQQRGTEVIVVRFPGEVCQPCPVKSRCTTSTGRGRQLTLRPHAVQQALDHARAEQTTKTWQDKYALRAGVESTIAQSVKVTDTRHARYRGLPKPTSNTSSKPSPSTSSASTPGGTATPSTDDAPATFHAWNSPSQHERELASGVRLASSSTQEPPATRSSGSSPTPSARDPGAQIIVSGMPLYQAGHVCFLAGAGGPELTWPPCPAGGPPTRRRP